MENELQEIKLKEITFIEKRYKEKMSVVAKEEIVADIDCSDGIIMECSTIETGEIVHITIINLMGDVLINKPVNPYFENDSFCASKKNRLTKEDIEAGFYPHEIYADLKRIINGTTKIIVYNQEHLPMNFILWRLASSEVLECDDSIQYDRYDNLNKIIDISQEFAVTYGEEDINGVPVPQSLFTCYQYYTGNADPDAVGDMYDSLHRCYTISNCYKDMEEEKKEKSNKTLEEIYIEKMKLAEEGQYCMTYIQESAITDGVILSGRLMTDEKMNTELVRLSITNMTGDVLFDSFIQPYVVKHRIPFHDFEGNKLESYIGSGRYPHEAYYAIKKILGMASYVITYDEAIECVLADWGTIGYVELDEKKMKRISGWFNTVYGEMMQDSRAFKEQSLYTCARTLGYPKYNELNLGDTVCECHAIGYCYQKMIDRAN